MPDSNDPGREELKRRLRRCTAALAGDTRDPLLLSEMAEVLTLLGRGAEAVSFRLNAAKCFQKTGLLAEAATSCDLLLELEADHAEALVMRVDLPLDGAPRSALEPPSLPEVDEPGEEDEQGDYGLRSHSTQEVEDVDVLESNTALGDEDEPDEDVLEQLRSVDIDIDNDTVLPEDADDQAEAGQPEQPPAVTEEVAVSESAPEEMDEVQATTQHEQVDDRPTTRHNLVDDLPTTRHEAVMTPVGWGPEEGEEEVIELRAPARKSAGARDSAPQTAQAEPEPTSQPLEVPSTFMSEGEERTFEAGGVIINEHDQANELMLLTSGKVEVLKATWAHQPGRNRFHRLAILEAGSCLGELALLGDGRRHATVKALEPSAVRVFTKTQVKALMRENADVNRALRRLYRQRLQNTLTSFSSLFQAMPPEVTAAFLKKCKPRRVEPDQVVVREGTQASGIHIVMLGMLDVNSNPSDGNEPVLLHRLSDGDFFGGISHILKQLSPGTVRTRTFVQLLYMSPPAFDELTEEYPIILDLMRPEAERRVHSYHSILAGEAQYEVGTFVYLLEKKKGKDAPVRQMMQTGWGAEDEE